jgi:hypothetical protein
MKMMTEPTFVTSSQSMSRMNEISVLPTVSELVLGK